MQSGYCNPVQLPVTIISKINPR